MTVDCPPTLADCREAGAWLSLAAKLQRYLPRGKGFVPRLMGRLLNRRDCRFLTTRNGAKLVLSTNSLDVYATMRLNGNSWDYWDFLICLRSLVDGYTFYDIGANVGYFTIEMAHVTKGSVRVVGFEPQTPLVNAINASIQLNEMKNVSVVHVLVGDESRMAEVFLSKSSIHASAVTDSGRNATHSTPQRMVAIDDLVSKGEIPPPDFIKLDVEGSEHLVIRGAMQTLLSARPNVFLEYIPEDDTNGRVRQEVESLVSRAGCYDLYGSPRKSDPEYKDRARQGILFRIQNDDDWKRVDGVYLRNRQRKVRDESMFL